MILRAFLPVGSSIAGLVVLVIFCSRTMANMRRKRGAIILSYLEQATRLNLPLPQMIRAASLSEKGAIVSRLDYLEQLLRSGYTVGEALRNAVPEITPRIAGIVDASERMGCLPQRLRTLLGQERSLDAALAPGVQGRRLYPLAMLLAFCSIALLLNVFVMPKMHQIIRDFGITMPPLSEAIMDIVNTIAPVLIVVLLCLVFGAIASAIIRLFRIQQGPIAWLRHITDRIVWIMPFAGQLHRNRGLADICQTLADALRNGRTLNQALDETLALDLNMVLAGRVQVWRWQVANGRDIAEAARVANMGRLLAGMILSAPGEKIPEALDFLGQYYRAKFSRIAILLNSAMLPAVTIILGILTAGLAAALFMPMIELVRKLLVYY